MTIGMDRRRLLAAVAITGLALGGCASSDLFHDVPDEKTPQPAYPNVGELPPDRPRPPLTAEEQARTEAELKGLAATRRKAVERSLESDQ
ncbi:hypothetical protein [Blastochloris tepida]|uniref:hypothetical protein n=1 Tax=Blastochloris tepida TaxID=2233851 RepID=UPI000F82B8DF|nr:hypothetical protein [Blastochloris tepida]